MSLPLDTCPVCKATIGYMELLLADADPGALATTRDYVCPHCRVVRRLKIEDVRAELKRRDGDE